MYNSPSIQQFSARSDCVVSCTWEHIQHSCEERTYQDLLARPKMATVHHQELSPHGRYASVYHDTTSHDICCHSDSPEDQIDDIEIDSDSSEDQIDDDDRIVVAQQVCLNNHEKNRHVKLLPVGLYV